jgi:hypothetical protein
MTDFNQNSPQVPVQPVEKPTSVTVFGILNIVFGGMGLICTPFSLLVGVPAMQETMQATAPYRMWTLAAGFIGIGFSIWLLVLGIGLVTMKKWARGGSVIYACVMIVWIIVIASMNIAALSLKWINVPETGLPGFIGGTVGGMCGGLIYPILLLIFMQTAKVKQAFQARGQSA